MRVRKEIKEADKILDEASKKLSFSIISPTNEASARRNFFNKKIKNPILKYRPPVEDLLTLRRKVSSINIDERDLLDTLFFERQRDVIKKIDLLNSVGCFDFSEKSRKLYGIPSKKLVNKSYEILNKEFKDKKSKKVLAKEAIKLIKENFQLFGLKYKLKRGEIVASCLVKPAKREIILKKKARFSASFINRLIVHEIGTHAFRYENGAQQKLKIFSKGTERYIETEEGLAVYNEERFGVLKESFLRNYAGRVIAVNVAQTNDFFNTFKELKTFFDKKTAFQLTLRAKRGLSNTELPGGYTKDHTYLKGYYQVKDYIKKGGKLERLYFGKINVNDLKIIKLVRLKKPKLLPNKFLLFEKGTENGFETGVKESSRTMYGD